MIPNKRHFQQLNERQGEPVVPGLVEQLELALPVVRAGRDAVVLGDPDAPAEQVAGRDAGLEGEGAGVDDLEASVRLEVGPLLEALDAVGPLGEVVGALGHHLELEPELAVAEHEVRHGPAPGLEADLGLLDEDVERVLVLLHEAEEVDELAADLGRGLALAKVLLALDLLVAGREDQGHVHVEVVGVLDAADELLELVLEVLAALRGHHEVVLEVDGETVADGVPGVRPLALGERAGGGLVGHAGRHGLVEGPDVPLDLAVHIVVVAVRQDDAGERAVGGVGDEAIDAVREPRVGPLEDVRQVPAPVPLVLLEVVLDVAGGGPEDVLVVAHGGLRRVAGVRAAPVRARVPVGDVRCGQRERTLSVGRAFVPLRHDLARARGGGFIYIARSIYSPHTAQAVRTCRPALARGQRGLVRGRRRGVPPVQRGRRARRRGVREDLAAQPEVVPAQPVGAVGRRRRVPRGVAGDRERAGGVARRRVEQGGLEPDEAGPDALEHREDAPGLLLDRLGVRGLRRAGPVAERLGRGRGQVQGRVERLRQRG